LNGQGGPPKRTAQAVKRSEMTSRGRLRTRGFIPRETRRHNIPQPGDGKRGGRRSGGRTGKSAKYLGAPYGWVSRRSEKVILDYT